MALNAYEKYGFQALVPRDNCVGCKYIDTAITTSLVQPLNVCSRGTTATTRIGQQTTVTHVAVNLMNTEASTLQSLKVALVLDTQPNAALASATDIYASANSHAFPNVSNEGRFLILHEIITVPQITAQYLIFQVNIGFPCTVMTQFNANNAGNISDLQTNALLLVVLATDYGGSPATPTVYGSARVRFIDE